MLQTNLSPQAFQPAHDSPFLLSKPEFIAVQSYVEAGKRLPATEDDLQIKLGIGKEEVGDFKDLITVYAQIVNHTRYFSSTTFPASVGLAADIAHYGKNEVPTYYGALYPLLLAWENGTIRADKAQKKLTAVLDFLRTVAISYQDKAKAVKESIHEFVEETKKDKSNLEPVRKRYQDKYQSDKGSLGTLMAEAENARKQIEYWNEQYRKDVTVAATTATYAWIFPFGTIAAAIVAGIYGDKAQKALEEVRNYQKKLATAQTDLRKALNLLHDLELADVSMDGILQKLAAALPVLEKIEGTWGAIADDIGNIITVNIDQGIALAAVIIKELGVDAAIKAWGDVAKIADQYHANAYIRIHTETAIVQNPQQYVVPQA